MMISTKHTAFYSIHKQLGAKIVEFAGFEMPVQYKGIIEEHRCVRGRVGVFDVSHMGEIEVWGRDAAAFVQKTTVNDVSKLTQGRVQYSAMCYPDGGIVDDLLVYRLDDHFMFVVNASNTAKDFAWMKENVFGDVKLIDKSDDISLLAIQGPQSLNVVKKLTEAALVGLQYYHFLHARIAGTEMLISRTGYTGELGFEMYFPAEVSLGERIWSAVMEAGQEFGIQPIGLGARDTLRLEMGFRLYGNDIDETTNPLEAGLGWITKLDKGDFIGRDALREARRRGLSRRLLGFVISEHRAVARHGYEIRSNGISVGNVTSGSFSPTLEKNIGMGYVASAIADSGAELAVVVRGVETPTEITPIPFVEK